MLVVREEKCAPRPVRALREGTHDAVDELLANLHVRRRVLLVLRRAPKGGINERHLRQRAHGRVAEMLADANQIHGRMVAHVGMHQGEREV